MQTTTPSLPYKGFRFPQEMIAHAVWLYFRFSLSYRDVEELLAERGMVVSYETIRKWSHKFGQTYANQLRRRRARPGDKWHLDELFLKINGKTHYVWRAVDQDGNVLDILVQSRRNKAAAKKFFTPSGYPSCSRAVSMCRGWSSRTSSGATRQPSRRSCRVSSIVAIGG